jgi:hypothetical protein
MSKAELIHETINNLQLLSDKEVEDVKKYTEFLLFKIDNLILSKEVSSTNLESKSYQFLEEDVDVYTVNDLKVKYKE